MYTNSGTNVLDSMYHHCKKAVGMAGNDVVWCCLRIKDGSPNFLLTDRFCSLVRSRTFAYEDFRKNNIIGQYRRLVARTYAAARDERVLEES